MPTLERAGIAKVPTYSIVSQFFVSGSVLPCEATVRRWILK